MTVKEAGEQWNLGARAVALYCREDRIEGAIKKGNLWLIPKKTAKPEDRRCKKDTIQEQKEPILTKGIPKKYESSNLFQTLHNKDLYFDIVKHFPHPMHICAPDGTMLYANDAFYQFVKVSHPKEDLSKHNVLHDPGLESWGIKEFVQRAYQGEVVHAYDVKVPIQEMVDKFGGDDELLSESLFHDMTAFPIYNESHHLAYIVTVFVISRYYQDREEIIKGKEYIDSHWNEEFDIGQLADIVHMSRYHYTRLFKQHTGMTPYNYYQEVKFEKFKELLCDKSLSITDIFDECGLDYSGSMAKKIKQKLGMTPSQYRKMMTKP